MRNWFSFNFPSVKMMNLYFSFFSPSSQYIQSINQILESPLSPESKEYYRSVAPTFNLEQLRRTIRAAKEKLTCSRVHRARQRYQNNTYLADAATQAYEEKPFTIEQCEYPYINALRNEFGAKDNHWTITDDFIDILDVEEFVQNNQKISTLAALLSNNPTGLDYAAVLTQLANQGEDISTDPQIRMFRTLFAPTGSEHQIIMMASLGAILLEEVVT